MEENPEEKESLLQRFRGWLFRLEIEYQLFALNAEYRIKKFFYCRKGYHRICRESASIQRYDKKKKKLVTVARTEFMRCRICHAKFFTNEKAQRSNERLNQIEKKRWKELFESMTNASRKDKDHGNKATKRKG